MHTRGFTTQLSHAGSSHRDEDTSLKRWRSTDWGCDGASARRADAGTLARLMREHRALLRVFLAHNADRLCGIPYVETINPPLWEVA
ncbi:MAG: hypothetical protein ACK4XK_07955, partial [Casimicrobiaceae bacterium]